MNKTEARLRTRARERLKTLLVAAIRAMTKPRLVRSIWETILTI